MVPLIKSVLNIPNMIRLNIYIIWTNTISQAMIASNKRGKSVSSVNMQKPIQNVSTLTQKGISDIKPPQLYSASEGSTVSGRMTSSSISNNYILPHEYTCSNDKP